MSRDFMRWNKMSRVEVMTSKNGPFSIPNSSYRTTTIYDFGHFTMNPKANLSSFSLSFYLYITGNEVVGILINYSPYRFSLIGNKQNLEFHTHNSTANPVSTVTSFTFSNVFKPNQWTFVGLVYNAERHILELYDESANVVQFRTNVKVDQVLSSMINVGYGERYGIGKYFATSSALACMSLHDVVLSQMEMALLPCACQFKDKLQLN